MVGTTVQVDVVVLLILLGVGALLSLGVLMARELAPALPRLPDDDCPPPGLSRLVPVGAQLEQECRTGLAALELWLAGRRVGP